MSPVVRLGLIGCGAIGTVLLEYLAGHAPAPGQPRLQVQRVVVPQRSIARVQALLQRLGLQAQVSSDLQGHYDSLDVLVECAGHAALEMHVVPALAQGSSVVVCSVGACAHEGLFTELEQASRLGGGRMQFVAGAVGAIDALAAARHSGLTQVRYQGIKPALAWQGTPAETALDLHSLQEATVFFEGTAREAAQQYPQNANVAATIALAGMGFDKTQVQLIADPQAQHNQHHIVAQGGFGQLQFEVQGRTLPDNPKTSALTAYSLIQAVLDRIQPWYF